jgi:endonuclease/exonuclease/phosphatase family metal-dependent hydrolase
VVLVGDLNSPEDDGAYRELTCGRYIKKEHDTASRLIKLNDNQGVEAAKQAAAPVRTAEGHISLPTHKQFRRGKLDPAHLKPLNERHGFEDARYELESRLDGYQGLSGPYGHYLTFTGFGNSGEDPPSRLDYILLANNVKATRYAVLENKYEDGLLISDHRPVMATVKF